MPGVDVELWLSRQCMDRDAGTARFATATYDLDSLTVATPFLRKCREREMGIPASHLVIRASHNHSAPIAMRSEGACRADGPIMVTAPMGERNLPIPIREHVRGRRLSVPGGADTVWLSGRVGPGCRRRDA